MHISQGRRGPWDMPRQRCSRIELVIGFFYRYGLHIDKFCAAAAWDAKLPPEVICSIKHWMPRKIGLRAYLAGLSRYSLEEVNQLSFDDISSISDWLGSNQFFFGDEMTTVDCTIFGHLAQFLYIPMDFPQREHMMTKCENLVAFMSRVQDNIWKDGMSSDEDGTFY